MVGTRRKSKAAAAAAAEETASQPEETTHVALNISLPDDLDLDALSSILPDTTFSSPSPETILSLYRILLTQVSEGDSTQRELEETRAEVERKEVELDQAYQDRESQTKELEASLELVQSQLNEVRREREHLAIEKTELQAQITSLTTSQSTSSTEGDLLRRRVEDAEREKRDLISVVSRLKEDATQRDDEIQNLRSALKQARHDHQSMESQVRELRSSEASTKFKIDSLTQQVQLAHAETERATNELNSKLEEFAKFRRAKHAEIAQLQASYDALTQTHASTENSMKALQSAHNAQSHKLTQALARVQDLTTQLAEQEATYASEASGLKRLVSMMEEREKQAKDIMADIEREWAVVGEKAEKRESALRAEAEREREARTEVEKRLENLEAVLDRLNRGELPLPGRRSSVPGTSSTPARTPANGDFLTDGMLGLSPTVAMVSKAQRSGKTFTEVYADYVRLQEDYTKKCAEFDHMDRTLSSVLAQIEERAPVLSQQRAEYERLQEEAALLSSQLARAISERDSQASSAQETAQKLKKSTQENDLLQKQLTDLGRQIQALLKELGRRNDPSIPSDEELEEMQLPAENIEAVITNNLVLYSSIGGLQEQNQKLLKIVRELGAKMEAEERDYREALDREQSEAIREAHVAIQALTEQLERQKKSSELTIQAYMKERDALKSMLARTSATSNGSVVNGTADISAPASADLAKELEEVQVQFESYKKEMNIDSATLRDEVVFAQREVGQLSAALAKANAKVDFLNDRQHMTQEQLLLQSGELENLRKRNQQLYDQYTRIDIECNRATEDLSIANSHVEQLRNECANLRAEKRIWESVQHRLEEENKNLSVERAHLSDLMVNVQRMHNDLERSGQNDRHRLESQISMLESQAQDFKTQLSQERDAVRHLSMQKDIEVKDLHNRLDKNAEELAKAREACVAAETNKIHLQERVDELFRQLQGNEEKLAVYERRTSSAQGLTQVSEQDLPREQRLEQEVAELRSTLKVAEVDLQNARSHVQQFQEISQANESALTALNATHDEYKASTEAQLAKSELELKSSQERLHAAEQELAQAAAKYGELQRTLESERSAWANDKKTLEDTIVDLSTTDKHFESDRTLRENEIRQLEERAVAAEERYSREILAHAELIKTIDTLKQQLSAAQTTSRESLASAESAQAKLSASESSWKHQKDALDKEISDLTNRCKDLSSQNALLHQHLESVSSQAARIRQATDDAAVSSSGDNETTDDADIKVQELRSVVGYLRKEKEIVDLQLELSKQENLRLKTQIEHLSQNLSDTRATLAEERERAVQAASTETQHAELMERINQLNILRESNTTLRSECETYAKRSRELEAKVKALSAELEPVKEEVRVARAELEARDLQIKRLEDESRRWQERNSQLLSKSDRIDPAELQSLKDEVEALKTQKTALENSLVEKEQSLSASSERVQALEQAIRSHKERSAKTYGEYKTRMGDANNQNSQLKSTISDLRAEIKQLTATANQQIPSTSTDVSKDMQEQLESLRREKDALEKALTSDRASVAELSAKVTEQSSTMATLQEDYNKLLAEKATWSAGSSGSTTTTDAAKASWDVEKNTLIQARDEALSREKAANDMAKQATDEAKNTRLSNEKFQTRLSEVLKARASDNQKAAEREQAAVAAAIEKVKKDMQSDDSASNVEETTKRHAAELNALREQLAAQYQAELKAAVDAAVAAAKAEVASISPSSTDADRKAAIEAAIAAHDREMQSRHAEEIAAAVDRGRMEQAAKGKLKDAQLVRAQTRLKELEAQVLEWRKAGIIPDPPAAADAIHSTPSASSASAPPPSPVISAPAQVRDSASTSMSEPVRQTPTVPAAALPRKPSLSGAVALGPTPGATRGAAHRGARGGARGGRGLSIRGAAPGGAASASAMPATGVSIMGAANKRNREEGELPDDSLAKRLKPAEPLATGSKPVTLRRPPPS